MTKKEQMEIKGLRKRIENCHPGADFHSRNRAGSDCIGTA